MNESFVVTVINTLFPNSQLAMLYILISLVAIWLYKQFRTHILESQKNISIKTEKAIEIYSELDAMIRKVLREKLDSTLLDGSITKASSYLPYDLLNEFYKWMDVEDEAGEAVYEGLEVLCKKVKDEIMKLKRTQFDSVTYRNNGGMMEFVEVYYKTKLVSLFEPLFHTAINLLVLLLTVVVFGTIAVTDEWTQKVFLVSVLIAGLFFLLVLDLILSEVLLKKRFIHSIKNWVAFSLFIIVPILLTLWGQWYIGVIILGCIFVYAYYASSYSVKNMGGNRTAS